MAGNSQTSPFLMKLQAFTKVLSKAEKQVVNCIIEDPESIIHLSVAGLAEKSGSSEATVIRACRKLGLSGYQDLKVTLAQGIVGIQFRMDGRQRALLSSE